MAPSTLSIILFSLLPFFMVPSSSQPNDQNSIDRCWRGNPNWATERQQMATCSAGFAGKMTNNVKDVKFYEVTDPNDDPLNPAEGTLRFGATKIPGAVWITFRGETDIRLKMPLLVPSLATIDGRGANVQISNGPCFILNEVTDVIIHGITFHNCKPTPAGQVMGPDAKVMAFGDSDGDGIAVLGATKVWIDHNTLYTCDDGLIDVTKGSTDISITNNRFRDHDKVMLLGHADDYVDDKKMKVTVAFNHFGPNCNQRMPRVRWGYAHVANNLYESWTIYAIGGSMNPSIKSQGNYFVAPNGEKEVTEQVAGANQEKGTWNFKSVDDHFENGAVFTETGDQNIKPNYRNDQVFELADAKAVKTITRLAGVLQCAVGAPCVN